MQSLVCSCSTRSVSWPTGTYELRSDHSGGWLVVLRGPGRDVRLEARGWRLPDGRRTTRAEVATALADLGLSAFER
jgi:hypothetical protein